MNSLEEIGNKFASYWQHHKPGQDNARVERIERIHGGASRQTLRVHLSYDENGARQQRGVILRLDPPSSLIDTQRYIEHNAYVTYFGSAVPVPEPLFLEMDTQWLGYAFSVTAEIAGGQVPSMAETDPYGEARQQVGEQFWSILGHIAAKDVGSTYFAESAAEVTAQECWRKELDHWVASLAKQSDYPNPVLQAAIRWLYANPPPPAEKLSLVHGDYRSGNFIYNPERQCIAAILDWEMCHVGDPLEDITWGLNPLWHFNNPLPAAMIPESQALACWEQTSGLKVDPEALFWWKLFTCVKGIAIWSGAGHEYANSSEKSPPLAFAALFCQQRQNRITSELLGQKLFPEN